MKERGSKGSGGSYREGDRRMTHFRVEREKAERKRGRKTPLFLPGGGGNSEPGCHVDN